MKGKAAVVLLSGLLFACVQAPPPTTTAAPPPAPPPAPAVAPAPVAEAPPANRRVSIGTATCGTYLQLADDDRAAATMFYIGYTAERLKAKTINVTGIPETEARAIRYCEAYPKRPVAAAFRQALR